MIEAGTLFGAYRIQDKLGEGGMGTVYRALDTELQRPVAIKTLLGTPDADGLSRFLREAKAASRLQHPTVVTIYHIGVESGTRYIVMELIEGNTLKKVIGGRPMNLRQACDIAIQVCDGLAAAHEMGVIHRDIKAENVIISSRGAVKILDFGLAKLAEAPTADEATVLRTEMGVVMGTMGHMSPEQALGQEVDDRSDIFSFGVMLYEMLTGRTPFAAQTAQAMLARVLNHEPEPVTQSNSAVTPELDQVVRDCLQKDRALRPSALEVLTMLKSVRDSLSSGPARTGATVPAPAPSPGAASGIATSGPSTLRPSAAPSVPAAPRPAPIAVDVAAPAGATAEMRATYWALRALRIVVTIATATVPLSFLLYFLIGGGVIRADLVEGTPVMSYMTAIVAPLLEVSGRVLSFRTIVDGWNLLLPVMIVVAMVLRRVVHLPFLRAEHWAKGRIARVTRVEAKGPTLTAGTQVADQRIAMLREYAETKKLLFQQKRRLAFLSAAVIGAARLKAGQDKLVIEHAFAEYRKYVERILASNNVWKLTWQAENVLGAFFTIDAAVRAGQQIISELAWFNDGVHQLRFKFEVHCGVSIGEVVFPEDKKIEDLTDETLDLAIALRDRAPSGAVWVSPEALAEVADASGFKPVAGEDTREWRPGGDIAAPVASPAQPGPVPDLTRTMADHADVTIGPGHRPAS
jgi:hypothetical protein